MTGSCRLLPSLPCQRSWRVLGGLMDRYTLTSDLLLGLVTTQAVAQLFTCSSPVIAQAKRWLTTCETHSAIHANAPARGDIRLVSATHLTATEPIHYAALSYCWGEESPLKLMKASRNTLEEGAPFEVLAQVVRDAAQVTRLLGLRWLWVDSMHLSGLRRGLDSKGWENVRHL